MIISDKFTVCVDFDGVIAEYDDWHGRNHFGDPLPGVREALEEMKLRNWNVIIFSCRGNMDIEDYMLKYDLFYTWINANPLMQGNNPGKPGANLYIDDHAIRFESWSTFWPSFEKIHPEHTTEVHPYDPERKRHL